MTKLKQFTDDEMFEMQMGRPKNALERDMDESVRVYGKPQCFVCGFSENEPTHDAGRCAEGWRLYMEAQEDER